MVAEIPIRIAGNELMIAVHRDLLGLAHGTIPLNFEFKWADNIDDGSDSREFLLHGDAAPNGRFNYRYQE